MEGRPTQARSALQLSVPTTPNSASSVAQARNPLQLPQPMSGSFELSTPLPIVVIVKLKRQASVPTQLGSHGIGAFVGLSVGSIGLRVGDFVGLAVGCGINSHKINISR